MKKNVRDAPKDIRSVEFAFRGIEHNTPMLGNLKVKSLSVQEIKEALNECAAHLAYLEGLKVDVKDEIQALEDRYEVLYSKWYSAVSKEAPKGATEGYKKSEVIVQNSKQYKLYLRNKRALESVRGKINALVKGYETQSRTLQSIAGLTKQQLARLGGELTPGSIAAGNKNLEEL